MNSSQPNLRLRLARPEDMPVLSALMDRAIGELLGAFLPPEGVKASFEIMGLDTQLITDGAYFVVEDGEAIAGCGGADSVAAALGAHVVSRDNIQMRALPPPLQATLASMQIGQTTQPFGAAKEGISVLVLCGRDMPQTATAPDLQEIENRLLEEKVNKRAQRYLRDLRREAFVDVRI